MRATTDRLTYINLPIFHHSSHFTLNIVVGVAVSLLITTLQNNRVQMIADTRVTAMTGGFQTLAEGKIVKSVLQDGSKELLVGTVGNADHHSLVKYFISQRPVKGDTWNDVFEFFSLLYEDADNKGMEVFNSDTGYQSSFHIAFGDKAWEINGLSIEPIMITSALGSGADVAFGAMAAGSTPFRAAKIACDHNVYCSFPIDVWEANKDNRSFTYNRYDEYGDTQKIDATNNVGGDAGPLLMSPS